MYLLFHDINYEPRTLTDLCLHFLFLPQASASNKVRLPQYPKMFRNVSRQHEICSPIYFVYILMCCLWIMISMAFVI